MSQEIAPSPSRIHRVLIVGGGFAGVYTALNLERRIRPGEAVEVTLISRENFFLYTPMLTEVAASAIETSHVVNPIRSLFRTSRFIEGEVLDVDLQRRCVVTRLPDGAELELAYDQLVLAFGATTSFHGMADVERNATSVKTLGDAIRIRNWVIQTLEIADVEADPHARAELLTYVVVGGGFTGVEVTGALNVFVREALSDYSTISPHQVKVVLVEGARRLLPEFDESLAAFATATLERAGVDVRLNDPVSGASERATQLKSGATIPTRTIVWASGVQPVPLARKIDVPKNGRGWIKVNADFSIPDRPGIWALGDCAHIPDPLHPGKFYPALAQHAIREGRQLARNILAVHRGEPPREFRYRTLGQLAALGHRNGIATVGPLKMHGYLAWALWRGYYLYRLPRVAKKTLVAIDWVYEEIFGRDISQIQVFDPVRNAKGPAREGKRGAVSSGGKS